MQTGILTRTFRKTFGLPVKQEGKLIKAVDGTLVHIPDDLPYGQKLLKLGFNRVTKDQMRERFACQKIQDAENARRRQKAIDDFLNKHPDYYFETEGTLSGSNLFLHFYHKGFQHDENIAYYDGKCEMVDRVSCFVKFDKLENYIKDTIPKRVIKNIKFARKHGLENFFVAYPMMGVPQTDPIVVAPLGFTYEDEGDEFVEVGYWE